MLLGYEEVNWDESLVEKSEDCDMCQNYGLDYPCDWEYQMYYDDIIGELLPELSAGLKDLGWEFGFAMGYVGWMNSFGQTKVKEVDSVFLKYMVFDTINDSNITAKLDFTHVDKGVIVMRRSHHDRPMGETIYIFKAEEKYAYEEEYPNEDEFREKLYDLGLEERPVTFTIVKENSDTSKGEWEEV